MYRLLFKVRTVHLRLREEVEVQVVIKKGHENFIIPQKAKLINGIANFQAHSQFFLSQKNPIFDVFVMILYGTVKKFAGMCEIDLQQWQQNSNNETTCLLLKSPDATATIGFNFMYLTSDIKSNSKSLISIGQLQSLKKSQYIKEMQDKYSYLTNENSRLNQQVEALRQKNRLLIQNKSEMEFEHNKASQDYENKIKSQSIEMENSENNLNRIKQKMGKIQELVKIYGETQLKEKIGDLCQNQS